MEIQLIFIGFFFFYLNADKFLSLAFSLQFWEGKFLGGKKKDKKRQND
jgi:hypothetical protein